MLSATNFNLRGINSDSIYRNIFAILIIWMAAAASFTGFINKWGLRDGYQKFGLEVMLDGTAYKPFVYRQLTLKLSIFVNDNLPKSIKDRVQQKKSFQEYIKYFKLENKSNDYKFKHFIIYSITFMFFILALLALYITLLEINGDYFSSLLTTIFFGLLIPYLETEGGYFYDFPEIAFMFLAIRFCVQNNLLYLVCTVVLATLNKESFLLFIPTLYPLIASKNSPKKSIIISTILILVAMLINIAIKQSYAHNSGGVVEFHLIENLKNYIKIGTYLEFETTYGALSPRGFNIINIFIFFILLRSTFAQIPKQFKQHIVLCSCISIPLFISFAATNEIRNLSFLYFGFCLLLSYNIRKLQANSKLMDS
jgi:hypothetical protein